MTTKERYRFFPITQLQNFFSSAVSKGRADVTVNGAPAPRLNMNLMGEMNDVRIKCPKGSFSEVFIEIKVLRGTSAKAAIHYLPSDGFVTCHLKVTMGEGSSLELAELTRTHSHVQIYDRYIVGNDCSLKVTTLDIDNRLLSRDQVFDINGKGADVNVGGIFLSAKRENIDNYIKMNHLNSDSESRQDYRGICSGKASFLGHIYIAQDSQRSVALQQSRNIVIGDSADIHARPWLEIYADDVKCNHGATVGTSDEEALFYMRQRGIPMEDAKGLLMEGFIGSIVHAADFTEVRNIDNIRKKLLTL